MSTGNRLFVLLSSLVFLACGKSKQQADLIIHHAKIYTVDSAFSTAEALAIKDGKFLAVGSNDEILANYEADTLQDLQGRPVYPGFYDAHCHFFEYANTLHQVNLVGVSSPEELVERVVAFRKKYPQDDWIIGSGWDQNKWQHKAFPNNEALNKLFPDVPVYLRRIDGHAALANAKALAAAGITIHRKQPVGGLIEHRGSELSGILVDNAMDLVQNQIPTPDEREMTSRLLEAEQACFGVGLTTIADAGLASREIDLLHKLYQDNKLRIREYAMVAMSPTQLEEYLKKGIYTSDQMDVRSFKIVGDGALGSRGACLLAPYSDQASQGFLLLPPAQLDTIVRRVAESDFQLNVHAIGDSTNRTVLNLFTKYLKGKTNRRWRIEHAQVISPSDFNKFKGTGIIPSVQPTHATSDMFWALDRLGRERLKGAYAYKQLLEEAGTVALGSDFPVEDINPLFGFHAAVARVNSENKPEGGFQMENALSREEALRGMTQWAAYACFQESSRGTIEKDKLADLVVLEQDIMKVPDTALRSVKVFETLVNGKTVFPAK